MTVKEAFDCYCLEVIQYGNQSRRTEEHHEVALKSLLKFTGEDISIENLTFEIVRKWKNRLEAEGKSVGTIYGYIVRLRCVLAHLQRKGVNCLHPDNVKPPKRLRHRTPGFLTEDEISDLIALASRTRGKLRAKRNAAIVSLMYSSGIRVGELVRLNRSDAHYDSFVARGKGSKDRPCFIDQRARYYVNEYLKARKDNQEALFVTDTTKERMSISTVQLIFRNLREKMGTTKHVTPHITRHSFATNFLRNNGNIRYLQDMLGHESLETTQVYAHVENIDLHRAHRQFHTIESPIENNILPDLPAFSPT